MPFAGLPKPAMNDPIWINHEKIKRCCAWVNEKRRPFTGRVFDSGEAGGKE
jgi:hypothetical protein